jgi:hypothetical protein
LLAGLALPNALGNAPVLNDHQLLTPSAGTLPIALIARASSRLYHGLV